MTISSTVVQITRDFAASLITETSRIQFWQASLDQSRWNMHNAAWWNLSNTFFGAGASSPKSPPTLLPHSCAEGGGENRSDSFLWNVVPDEGYFIQQEPSCPKTETHGLFQASPQMSNSVTFWNGSTFFSEEKLSPSDLSNSHLSETSW